LIFVIISDVHANLEAVEACFREIDKIKPDRIICLGDLVDYCAQPNEVMDIIRARCDVIVMGNHDEAQIFHEISDGFSERAMISSIHTRSVLKAEHKDFISKLNYTHSENGLLFVHGSPFNPEEYSYVLYTDDADIQFKSFDEKICFIGHSHQPLIFKEDTRRAKIIKANEVTDRGRYIINVGSVGQPRDGDPKLAFGVFNSDKFEFTQIRLSYDIKSASRKIIDEGLPLRLAERLFDGI